MTFVRAMRVAQRIYRLNPAPSPNAAVCEIAAILMPEFDSLRMQAPGADRVSHETRAKATVTQMLSITDPCIPPDEYRAKCEEAVRLALVDGCNSEVERRREAEARQRTALRNAAALDELADTQSQVLMSVRQGMALLVAGGAGVSGYVAAAPELVTDREAKCSRA
jgi:hypothetical protein